MFIFVWNLYKYFIPLVWWLALLWVMISYLHGHYLSKYFVSPLCPLYICHLLGFIFRITQRASLVAQTVKNPPVIQETWVWSLDGEDPLEEHMASHSSILPWRIPWTEEPGRVQSTGSQRVWHDWATEHACTYWVYIPDLCPVPLYRSLLIDYMSCGWNMSHWKELLDSS